MATSISKAQAEALNNGFFDQFGVTKDSLKLKGTFGKLVTLAGVLVEEAQRNLDRSDRVASGALYDSIKVLDPRVINGVLFEVDIELLFYFAFIDAGVKGTKRGSSGAGYSFKNDKPSKKMVAAFAKWIAKEGLKGTQEKK